MEFACYKKKTEKESNPSKKTKTPNETTHRMYRKSLHPIPLPMIPMNMFHQPIHSHFTQIIRHGRQTRMGQVTRYRRDENTRLHAVLGAKE